MLRLRMSGAVFLLPPLCLNGTDRKNFIPILTIPAQILVNSSALYNDWRVSGLNYHG
jgi:hypothetical protein